MSSKKERKSAEKNDRVFEEAFSEEKSEVIQSKPESKENLSMITTYQRCPEKRFVIESKMASSSIAEIHKGKDLFNRKKVAIKTFQKMYEKDAEREIEILNVIKKDENILCLKLIEYFIVDGNFHIVTALHGLSIPNYIKEFDGFNMDEVKMISSQLIDAVDFLHGEGIVHADIKPPNIVLSSQENKVSEGIKLIDLGNAEFETNFKEEREDRKFIILNYRAPEIILSLSLDHRVDIWALGCCIYKIFSTKHIFKYVRGNLANTTKPMVEQLIDFSSRGSERLIKSSKVVDFSLLDVSKVDCKEQFSKKLNDSNENLINLKSLILQLTQFDPENRTTLKEAKKHVFFKN